MKTNLPQNKEGKEGKLPRAGLTEQYSPFQAVARMHQEMDKMFENFLNADWPSLEGKNSFVPSLTTKENDKEFLLTIDAPGLTKSDLRIEVQENALHIFGGHKAEKDGATSFTSMSRWVSLPPNAKAEEIQASFEDGRLEIAVPKAAEKQSKRIEIS